jgi:hypothetical protein
VSRAELLELDDQQHNDDADRGRCSKNAAPEDPAKPHCRRRDGEPHPSSGNKLQRWIPSAGLGHGQVFQPPGNGGADPWRHSLEDSCRRPRRPIMKRPARNLTAAKSPRFRDATRRRGDCDASRRNRTGQPLCAGRPRSPMSANVAWWLALRPTARSRERDRALSDGARRRHGPTCDEFRRWAPSKQGDGSRRACPTEGPPAGGRVDGVRPRGRGGGGGDRLRAADRRGDERDGADSAIATRVAGDPLFYAARSAWWRPTDRRRTRTSTPASRSR